MIRHGRARRLLVALGTAAFRALRAYGAAETGLPAERFALIADPVADVADAVPATPGPPPAHPERVRPDLAPDRVERRLWAQLRWPADGPTR
ncbi:DUF6059 family protein [Dactylosporangium sp. NPDC049525]|uniref:DUF6059 family protein n=1 Tax=Dactylosporangium sp. NPDC049525 TaxID=3154730 RepID=UPI00341953A2